MWRPIAYRQRLTWSTVMVHITGVSRTGLVPMALPKECFLVDKLVCRWVWP